MTAGRARRRRRKRFDVVFYMPWMSALLAARTDQLPPGGAETQIRLAARMLAVSGLKVAIVVFPHEALPASVDGVEIIVRPGPPTRTRVTGKLREFASVSRPCCRFGPRSSSSARRASRPAWSGSLRAPGAAGSSTRARALWTSSSTGSKSAGATWRCSTSEFGWRIESLSRHPNRRACAKGGSARRR